MRTVPALVCLSALLVAFASAAQDAQVTPAPEPPTAIEQPDIAPVDDGPEVDPPGRVARLSFIRGRVSFQAADGETPEDAVINRPVTSGDRLITQNDSRAELTMGIAAVRVDANTDLSVAVLEDDLAQIEVNSGTVSVHVRELTSGNTFEIDTPNSAIRLLEPGDYRVDVAPDGTATLAVREGDAEMDTGSGPVRVGARQVAHLAKGTQFASVRGIDRMDEFDEWSVRRERELNGQVATRYVSREVVGYEDLDRYGSWVSEPEYGTVWYPTHVVAGWAPYRYGSWTWIGPWGWTWIDTAPWGFAPFHYGRWAFVRSRWCWVPGPRFRRPIYAPGLVVWTGWYQSGFGHSWRHHRPRSWYPLGPRDLYVPRHRVSPRYLRSVNVSNTLIDNNTLLTNAYRNRLRDFRWANRNVPGAQSSGPDHGSGRERHPRWIAGNDGSRGSFSNRGRDDDRRDNWRNGNGDNNRGDGDRNNWGNRNGNTSGDSNRGNWRNRGGDANGDRNGDHNRGDGNRNWRSPGSDTTTGGARGAGGGGANGGPLLGANRDGNRDRGQSGTGREPGAAGSGSSSDGRMSIPRIPDRRTVLGGAQDNGRRSWNNGAQNNWRSTDGQRNNWRGHGLADNAQSGTQNNWRGNDGQRNNWRNSDNQRSRPDNSATHGQNNNWRNNDTQRSSGSQNNWRSSGGSQSWRSDSGHSSRNNNGGSNNITRSGGGNSRAESNAGRGQSNNRGNDGGGRMSGGGGQQRGQSYNRSSGSRQQR